MPYPRLWAFARRKQISAVVIFVAAALPVCRLLLHENGLRRRKSIAAAFSIGRMVDCQRALHRRLRKNIAINSSERLAETLVMQAFLPEQRRSMRMDFRINGRPIGWPEKRTMRLRASIPLRRARGCERRRTRRRLLPYAAASGDYALGSEHALRAETFRAADMPWTVDEPSKSVGRRAWLARRQARVTDRAWSAGIFRAGHVSRGRVLSERRKNKRRF